MQTGVPKRPTYTSAFILLAIGAVLAPAAFYLVSSWFSDDKSGLSATLGLFYFSIPSFLSGAFLLASIGKFISVWHERKFHSSIQGIHSDNFTQESAQLVNVKIKRKLQNNYIASWILLILLVVALIGVISFSISTFSTSTAISLGVSIIDVIFIAIAALILAGLVFCIVRTAFSIRSLRAELKKNLLTIEDMK